MGRNYYCEYCDKKIPRDIVQRKKHIAGLQHQQAYNEHYQKFKDPSIIIQVESRKIPCIKYHQEGHCKFTNYCRFSHYTPEQINCLQQQVNQNDYKLWLDSQPKPIEPNAIDDYLLKMEKKDETMLLNASSIWKYPEEELKRLQLPIPPSLQRIDPALIPKSFEEWGK